MSATNKRLTPHLDGEQRLVVRRIGSETIIVPVAGQTHVTAEVQDVLDVLEQTGLASLARNR
jgi:hypothetical protein